MDNQKNPNLRFLKCLIIPIAIAIVLRIGLYFEFVNSPYFKSPSIDGIYHIQWAESINNTGKWSYPHHTPFFRAPLYPTFLAFLMSMGLNNELIVALQSMIGILTIYIVARLSSELFHNRIAIYTAYILAFFTPLMSYEMEFQLPALLVPLFVMIIFLLQQLFKYQRPMNAIFASLLIGCLSITQPNGIVLLIPFFYLLWKFRNLLTKKYLRISLFLWLLPILPVTIYNYHVSKEFTIISTQSGVNAYLGNNSKADGVYAVHPELGEDWEWGQAKNNLGKTSISDQDADKIFWGKVIDFWKQQPLSALHLTFKKVKYIFHFYEIGNNRNLEMYWNEFFVTNSFFARFFFGLLLPFGLTGIYLSRKNSNAMMIFLSSLLFMFSYVPFFITTRYRLPFAIIMILFSSYAIYVFVKNFKELIRDRYTVVVFFISLLITWHPFGAPKADASHFHYMKANALQNSNQYELAFIEYRKAINLNPMHEMYHNNLGTCFLQLGNLDSAAFWIKKANEISHGENARILNNLAIVQEKSGYYYSALMSYFKSSNLGDEQADANRNYFLHRYFYSPPNPEEDTVKLRALYDSLAQFQSELTERFLLNSKIAIIKNDSLALRSTLELYVDHIRSGTATFFYQEKVEEVMNELLQWRR